LLEEDLAEELEIFAEELEIVLLDDEDLAVLEEDFAEELLLRTLDELLNFKADELDKTIEDDDIAELLMTLELLLKLELLLATLELLLKLELLLATLELLFAELLERMEL